MAIRVLLVDAQALMAGALASALTRYPDLTITRVRPGTGVDTLEAASAQCPDVIVLDCWLPDMQGPALVRLLSHRAPGCRTLVLSGFYDPRQIEEALEAGAVGFLPKTVEVDDLAEAIRQAHAGTYPVDAQRLAQLRRHLRGRVDAAATYADRFASLTRRELEVLLRLNASGSAEDVAAEFVVSPKTVANHIQNILGKTGTNSRAEVLALAREIGFLQPPPSRWEELEYG
jgi:two-component system response regulator DesR